MCSVNKYIQTIGHQGIPARASASAPPSAPRGVGGGGREPKSGKCCASAAGTAEQCTLARACPAAVWCDLHAISQFLLQFLMLFRGTCSTTHVHSAPRALHVHVQLFFIIFFQINHRTTLPGFSSGLSRCGIGAAHWRYTYTSIRIHQMPATSAAVLQGQQRPGRYHRM